MAGTGGLPALWDVVGTGYQARGPEWRGQAAGPDWPLEMQGKECRKQFTVKVGNVFEHGRIPLHKMLQAVYLLCCSKKGICSHQLHRVLKITYKAAWFLWHRIREAMRDGTLSSNGRTRAGSWVAKHYIGRQEGLRRRRG